MTLSQDTLDKLHEKYLEMQMQQAMLTQQQQVYTTTNTGGFINALNPYAQQSPIPIEVPVHKLDEGAWDVPISQLVDLWTVRYGSKWVNDDELDEFYKITAKRLRALHKVESHYVNGMDVYRIVE
jgi:hypothetical protein